MRMIRLHRYTKRYPQTALCGISTISHSNILNPSSILSRLNVASWEGSRYGVPTRRHFSMMDDQSTSDSKRLVKIALMGNMAITTAKAACWLSTGSSAMLSETVHSLVDSGNQALLLVGIRGATAAPDKAHPCM